MSEEGKEALYIIGLFVFIVLVWPWAVRYFDWVLMR